ncbi:hypothetical protein QL285_012726 [Trifolium repens]|nr:hypothetical protein QL285_012726 [Trifolium repens]
MEWYFFSIPSMNIQTMGRNLCSIPFRSTIFHYVSFRSVPFCTINPNKALNVPFITNIKCIYILRAANIITKISALGMCRKMFS